MRRAARAVSALALLLAALLGVLVARTYLGGPDEPPPAPESTLEVDLDAVAARLAAAIRLRTIAARPGDARDDAPFLALREHLRESYPRALATAEVTELDHALVLRVAGADPSLAPLLLLAHTDVVPVPDEAAWTRPPFAGEVADGFVWGRGALDDKAAAIAILEALELALSDGPPARGVIVALGEDEEVGGARGAARVAAWLEEQGVRPFLVLDEGLALLDGFFPGLERPLAAVGVAEKGFATLELVARAEEGHASMPPRETAIGMLAAALARLDAHPPDATLAGPTGALLDRLAPELPFLQRVALSNRWLLGALVESQLAAAPGTNATIRTTLAPTVLEAGEVENALPATARALVNARVHPTQRVADVVAQVERAIDDPRVEVRALPGASEPTPVSPAGGEAWRALSSAIRGAAPDAVVAPALVVGATDARHYVRLGAPVYRFLPVRLAPDDLPRIHGVDERVSLVDLERMVRVYRSLIGGSAASE